MKKHYKNEALMKFLTIVGALVGLAYLIIRLTGVGTQYQVFPIDVGLNIVVNFIIGLVVVIITLLTGIRPNDPIPFHWLVLFILAILLAIFADILAAVLVLIAFIIGLIEDL
ncbi:MAG: hypothetical protein ACFFCV_20380 [Promethearchaeota archaeon]